LASFNIASRPLARFVLPSALPKPFERPARIIAREFSSRNIELIKLASPLGGHAGGDNNLLADFVQNVRDQERSARTSVKDSFESHYMAFAAEYSRLNKARTIKLEDFKTG
jgi:hypothetical protein